MVISFDRRSLPTNRCNQIIINLKKLIRNQFYWANRRQGVHEAEKRNGFYTAVGVIEAFAHGF